MKKIIFVDRDATVRAPMACEILKDMMNTDDTDIIARGLVVLFPEPINQKAEAVMVSNGIRIKDYNSVQLEKKDVDEETVILLIDPNDYRKTVECVGEEHTGCIHALNELAGEELSIMDPYGGVLGTYGICFETLSITIRKILDKYPRLDLKSTREEQG